MGQVIASVLSESEKQNEQDTVEQLQILQKLAAAKLEAKALQMATDAFEDKTLPIVAVVDKVERYAVKAESAPAKKVRECISNIFQGHFLKGIESAVGTAVNELLGNTSAGEQERSETHVVFANNSLLRVDYYCYKYEFGSRGFRDKFRNAFCYVVQVGVLDNLRVDPQVALYELGKSIGRDQIREASDTLEEDANLLENLYHVINRLRKAAAGEQSLSSGVQDEKYFGGSISQKAGSQPQPSQAIEVKHSSTPSSSHDPGMDRGPQQWKAHESFPEPSFFQPSENIRPYQLESSDGTRIQTIRGTTRIKIREGRFQLF